MKWATVTDADIRIFTSDRINTYGQLRPVKTFSLSFVAEPGNNVGVIEAYDEDQPGQMPVASGEWSEVVGQILAVELIKQEGD